MGDNQVVKIVNMKVLPVLRESSFLLLVLSIIACSNEERITIFQNNSFVVHHTRNKKISKIDVSFKDADIYIDLVCGYGIGNGGLTKLEKGHKYYAVTDFDNEGYYFYERKYYKIDTSNFIFVKDLERKMFKDLDEIISINDIVECQFKLESIIGFIPPRDIQSFPKDKNNR